MYKLVCFLSLGCAAASAPSLWIRSGILDIKMLSGKLDDMVSSSVNSMNEVKQTFQNMFFLLFNSVGNLIYGGAKCSIKIVDEGLLFLVTGEKSSDCR